MTKTMMRGPVRYSPGVLFLCQWPYRALQWEKHIQACQLQGTFFKPKNGIIFVFAVKVSVVAVLFMAF